MKKKKKKKKKKKEGEKEEEVKMFQQLFGYILCPTAAISCLSSWLTRAQISHLLINSN